MTVFEVHFAFLWIQNHVCFPYLNLRCPSCFFSVLLKLEHHPERWEKKYEHVIVQYCCQHLLKCAWGTAESKPKWQEIIMTIATKTKAVFAILQSDSGTCQCPQAKSSLEEKSSLEFTIRWLSFRLILNKGKASLFACLIASQSRNNLSLLFLSRW